MTEPSPRYQRFVLPVNPIPWRSPSFAVRRGKGGGSYAGAIRDEELYAYKEAVRAELLRRDHFMMEPPYRLRFWFYRRLDKYETVSGRQSGMSHVDATNMQKSTEDALQGIVIHNDEDVCNVQSSSCEQGPDTFPCVVIEVWELREPVVPPPEVLDDIAELRAVVEASRLPDNANDWPGSF